MVHHDGQTYEVLRHGAPSCVNSHGAIQPLLPYTPPVPTSVWVRQMDANKQLTGVPFEVIPLKNSLDALKDAIKKVWEGNKPTKIDALALPVYKQSAGLTNVVTDSVPTLLS